MNEPLAQRMRPKTLAEVCGQQHLLAPGRVFRRTIESGRIPNMIFYGPSGNGQNIFSSWHRLRCTVLHAGGCRQRYRVRHRQ